MRVFISSTSEDLRDHRHAAAAVVRDAQCQAVVMEHGPADPRPIVDVCREWVQDCDLVLLIVAFRRGWVPDAAQGGDGASSITALEIAEADRLNRPVLAFFADDNWPGKLWDDEADARAWVKRFRANLNRTAKFFSWEADPKLPSFRALISQELANYRTRLNERAAASDRPRPSTSPAMDVEVALRRVSLPKLPVEPYPLLGPYEHPATFGGRDADITRLASLVALPPLVLCVHAASGAGKSSLLLAGLAPRLREQGYTVGIERTLGDPQLAQRLLRDVFEPEAAIDLSDSDEDLPDRFATFVRRAHVLSNKPIVFVIDQVDDVLRSPEKRDEALARLGVLMAATAQRLPGVQAHACKWLLCYRHEFHGEVRAWLEDVLEQARIRNIAVLDQLPYDLSDTQKSHDWVLPVVGRPTAGERGLESSLRAFREAIEKPLKDENGYPYRFTPEGAQRLASVFAQARQAQPDAPLVPELQVVLNDLIEPIRSAATRAAQARDRVVVKVPNEQELAPLIDRALADHLSRAIDDAFPAGRDTAAGRTARTRALIALEHLADAEGRRGTGVSKEDLIRMIGEDGAAVIDRLAGPTARLVVSGKDGTYELSHDQLARVVVEFVRNEAVRGNLVVDQRLLDVRRVITQKLALYQGDTRDESALTLSHEQRALIAANTGALLVTKDQQVWWKTSEAYRSSQTKQLGWWAAAILLVMLVVGVVGYRTYVESRRVAMQSSLLQLLSTQRPDFARFAELVSASEFNAAAIQLDDKFVEEIDPGLFVAGHGLMTGVSLRQTLHVIERSHTMFLRSRPLFGAMSFALEELFVRSDDTALKERARTLAETIRTAFIAHHKRSDRPILDPPAGADADPLNDMRQIGEGRFQMGATDLTDDERPVHPVSVSDFRIQRHEVTNEEYARFDPAHESPAGQARHPVARVSWFEANAYAAWLGGSLPTEAEWEYAARGTGSSSGRDYPWPDGELDDTRAVYSKPSTEPVGSRPAGPTLQGLEDMAGNVREWCRDWYADYPDDAGAVTNPLGPAAGATTTLRVVRGGSFGDDATSLRAADRGRGTPVGRFDFIGFRLVSSRFRP